MAKIEKISSYNVKSGDLFFFDNNVWMILFSPIAGSRERQQKVYSQLFSAIQSARATIYINSLIVSEYINRSLRLSYSLWRDMEVANGNRMVDYKQHYRITPDFNDAKDSAKNEMDSILRVSERKPDDFNALNIPQILGESGMDFNDAYYAHFCKMNNLILVTDDRDLQNISIDITILTM